MVSLGVNQEALENSKVYVSIADQEQKVKEQFPFKYMVAELTAMFDGVIFDIFVPKFS